MKHIVLFPDKESAIGLIEQTDFLATLPKINEHMAVDGKIWGPYIEIEQKNENFIKPKEQDLYIEALEDGVVTFKRAAAESQYTPVNMQYRINLGEWQNCEFNNNIFTYNILDGQMISFRGNGTPVSVSDSNYSQFSTTCISNVGGNIMSLLNYSDTLPDYAFILLFSDCTNIISAMNLKLPVDVLSLGCYQQLFKNCIELLDPPVLPAMTLAESCYQNMFEGCVKMTTAPVLPATETARSCYLCMFKRCESITVAPELPAMTIARYCYFAMFEKCINLTVPPELPAKTLEKHCYQSMFDGCASLTVTPKLYTTTLSEGCYNGMFMRCTSLTTPPVLPATTLVSGCYNSMFLECVNLTTTPVLHATQLDQYCYSAMFYGCTSLTEAPELPATTLKKDCYSGMFFECTGLTSAPVLPAKTLVENCYRSMFTGCTNINYIKALFTTTPTDTYTDSWVEGVASTGTFIKSSTAQWNVTGINGVPEGWTVVTE